MYKHKYEHTWQFLKSKLKKSSGPIQLCFFENKTSDEQTLFCTFNQLLRKRSSFFQVVPQFWSHLAYFYKFIRDDEMFNLTYLASLCRSQQLDRSFGTDTRCRPRCFSIFFFSIQSASSLIFNEDDIARGWSARNCALLTMISRISCNRANWSETKLINDEEKQNGWRERFAGEIKHNSNEYKCGYDLYIYIYIYTGWSIYHVHPKYSIKLLSLSGPTFIYLLPRGPYGSRKLFFYNLI